VAQGRRRLGRLIGARFGLFLSVATVAVAVAACAERAVVEIAAEISPATSVVNGAIRVRVTINAGGHAVRGATLQVEGHMSHPGMAPVIAAAVEESDAAYVARLTPTMAGEWVFVVTGALPDGRRIRHEIGKREVGHAPGS
jgi:hypothetical protein